MKHAKLAFALAGVVILAQQTTPLAQTGRVTAIRGGTVLTVTRGTIQDGVVVLRDGKIAAVGGANTSIPAGADIVEAKGRFVTAGIIDAHSHSRVGI